MKLIVCLTVLLFLFAALVLSSEGCSTAPTPKPAPTVDVGAVQTQAALAIFATQTASIPTVTKTPIPTNTAAPTTIPLPTSTLALTNAPEPTATLTPSEVVLPAGWKLYTDITDQFSIGIPSWLRLTDQGAGAATWKGENFATLIIVAAQTVNPIPTGKEGLNKAVEIVSKTASNGNHSFRLNNKEIWKDAIHAGYLVEATVGEEKVGDTIVGGTEYYAIVMPWGEQGALIYLYQQDTFSGDKIRVARKQQLLDILKTLR